MRKRSKAAAKIGDHTLGRRPDHQTRRRHPHGHTNPTLELRDSNEALLIANNDWQDNAVQAAEIIAAGLAPTNNLESAVAAMLPPGRYTALLSGLNNRDWHRHR